MDIRAKTGMKTNEFQKAVLRGWAGGGFEHLAQIEEYDVLMETLHREHDDGLLEFMMSDLLTAESIDDAILRVEGTERDAQLALGALGGLVSAADLKA